MSAYKIGFKNTVLLLFTVLTLSCSDYTNSSAGQPLGKLQTPEEKMLLSIGTNVMVKNVQSFSVHADLLKENVEKYCQEQSAPTLKAAQDQWEKAMLDYHLIDAAPLGPITDNQEAANIYAWPSLNTCGIDAEVGKLALAGETSKSITANRRGLGALEYLLFNRDLSSRCNLVANAQVKTWLERTIEQKNADRCQYALVIAQDISEKAKALNQAWSPEQGNFTQSLVDGTRYDNTTTAITELTTSLFSLDKVKDFRLGAPLGLHASCVSDTQKCPEMIEHPWSGIGLQAIVAQLKGFRLVFLGGTGPNDFGYDDYMTQKKLGDVAQGLKTRLDKAIVDAENAAAKGSLQTQVAAMVPARCSATTEEDKLEPLCALFLEVQEVSFLFKTDVLTMLSIDNHILAPGDND